MPTWASILLAVIGPLGAGALGAGVTARNDRAERFRDRMIEAADEFTSAGADALVKLRDAIGAVSSSSDALLAKATTEGAWSARDRALARSARIDLLFGPGQMLLLQQVDS